MNKKNNILIFFSLLSSTLNIFTAEPLQGISTFSPRSQHVNAARDIVGWHPLIHVYDAEKNYTVFALTPYYNQSLRPQRIAQALFNTDTLLFSGSQAPNRGPNDIIADVFGLSPMFRSSATIDPLIQNFIFDAAVYFGLDSWVKGLYIHAHAPAVWTQWNVKLEEDVMQTGIDTPFPAGYMATQELQAPFTSFTDAIKGTTGFGQVQKLTAGKINDAQSKGGLAALDIVLGYNFRLDEIMHAGLNLRISAPTGSRPEGEFFFEPRIGNGKHWEFGIGGTAHGIVWEKDAEQELGFYIDVNLTHLFKSKQKRAFDFKRNGFASRYLLLKEFNQAGQTINIVPAINITTLNADVSVDIQADIVLMFGYTYRGFVFDIGYNGYIRSKEKISLRDTIPQNRFGIKGIQNATNNITESTATIRGTNFANQMLVADNPALGPVFISTSDINEKSAATPRIISHKIFFHFGNAWHKWEGHNTVPFFGAGFEIEFEGINERNTAQPDKTTMGQASVWLKGGFSFG